MKRRVWMRGFRAGAMRGWRCYGFFDPFMIFLFGLVDVVVDLPNAPMLAAMFFHFAGGILIGQGLAMFVARLDSILKNALYQAEKEVEAYERQGDAQDLLRGASVTGIELLRAAQKESDDDT